MRLKEFFHSPWFGVVGTIAGIIGTVLTIYFYFDAKQARHLVINLNPAQAVVVKAGQSSKLAVSYDGSAVASDITAAQLAIWNAGNTPIRTENILDPVTIVIPGAVILEATIRKVSRPLVKLEMNSGEAQKGKLQLSWAILEHADGAVIQIIYSGKPGALMIIEGTVEGQGRLAIELHDMTGPKPIAFLLFLGFGMFASGLLPFIFKRPRSSWDIVSDVVYLMFAVSVLALGFWVVWQNHLHAMPTFVLES